MLLGVMRKLASRGLAILFVTHFLDQVYAVCDRITVLRNGRLVGEARGRGAAETRACAHDARARPCRRGEHPVPCART